MKKGSKFIFTAACVCSSLLSFGQTESTPSPDSAAIGQNTALSYVKLEIRMHILDCPVLPAQLKEKLMTVKGIKDYTVDKNYETIQFNVPEGALTKESIEKITLSCGFPVNSVNILLDSKPFVN
jgi:hypothetical protein